MLCDTEVLAIGSMRDFYQDFNRCKHLHLLLATALHILHFRHFTELHGAVSNELIELLHELASNPSEDALSKIEESDIFIQLLDKYEQ